MSDYVRNFQSKNYDLQLTTDTAIYASGDVLVPTVAVPILGATIGDTTRVKIEQITVIDKDALSGAFDLVFLSDNKSLGTINAAVSITDADALSVVKVVPVTTYDVLTSGGQSVARIDLPAPIFIETVPGATAGNIYVGAISRDTKTYTASALYLRLGVQILDRSV